MINNKLYGKAELITKMMIINLLWFFSVLLGFVIFSFFPANAALMITVSKLQKENPSYLELINIFIKMFKRDWLKMMIFQVGTIVFLIILVSNFKFIESYNEYDIVKYLLKPMMILIALLGSVIMLNSFVINCLIECDLKELLLNSLKYAFIFPTHTIIMGLLLASLVLIILYLPGLIPVLSLNIYCYFALKIMNKGISIVNKQKELIS